jgi:thiamine biosynthesis lipoprotein
VTPLAERRVEFPCFGGDVTLLASDGDLHRVRARFEQWHRQLTRFEPTSELCLLNAHPGSRVRVSAIMACFVQAAIDAAHRTDGLVDPTLVDEIERAGYVGHVDGSLPLEEHTPRAAKADPRRRWLDVTVDPLTRMVSRPPGTKLDSGGIAKGLFADLAASMLRDAGSYAIDCCGDLRIGGRDGHARAVRVDDPFRRGAPLHEFAVIEGGVATSGIAKRSWRNADGSVAHHLLDPSTGLPAYTGLVQVTALAPTAADAEVRAKAALLSGPEQARQWLEPHGGAMVFDDGSHAVLEPR